ncbi:hypothetical protein LZ32DRAFT_623864, partial [Colletotrichum eremochloae]
VVNPYKYTNFILINSTIRRLINFILIDLFIITFLLENYLNISKAKDSIYNNKLYIIFNPFYITLFLKYLSFGSINLSKICLYYLLVRLKIVSTIVWVAGVTVPPIAGRSPIGLKGKEYYFKG